MDRVRPFFRTLAEGTVSSVTSTVTLLEVLVQPIRRNDPAVAEEYRATLLHTPNLRVLPLTTSVAEEAARLRAQYNVGFADAAQLATAITHGASHFLTNDARLARVAGLRVLVLDDLT